jgi:hypothetical protein
MVNRLAIAIFAAAFAASTVAVQAAGMPDTGTKNFVPGGDAPAYLVNENLTVAPGSAGQSPLGTAFNRPAGPAFEPASAERSPQTMTIRHDRLAERRTGVHRSAATRIKGHPVRAATRRTARAKSSAGLGRSARRSRFEHNAAAARRTSAARHARAGARHVAAKSTSRRG